MTPFELTIFVIVAPLFVLACIGWLIMIGSIINWAWQNGYNVLFFVSILVVFIIISTTVYLFQGY